MLDEEAAPIVRRMFEGVISGKTVTERDDVKNVEALRRNADSIMGEAVMERTRTKIQDISL